MNITPATGAPPPVQNNADLYEDPNSMDKEVFLKLLIAQLNYQDPLEPAANEQFVAQLAQFSSLEQMQNINESLRQSIESDFLLNQSLNNSIVTTLIGKDVVALTNEFQANGKDSVKLAFDGRQALKDVKVTIYDSSGAIVKEISLGNAETGYNTIDFDISGLSRGVYTFEVADTSLTAGTLTPADAYIRGRITGVSYEGGEARLVLDGTMLSLGDVARIVSRENGG